MRHPCMGKAGLRTCSQALTRRLKPCTHVSGVLMIDFVTAKDGQLAAGMRPRLHVNCQPLVLTFDGLLTTGTHALGSTALATLSEVGTVPCKTCSRSVDLPSGNDSRSVVLPVLCPDNVVPENTKACAAGECRLTIGIRDLHFISSVLMASGQYAYMYM
eukprot:scpid99763/ scgid15806/ 